MTKPITLKRKTASGDMLTATFSPEKGMNLLSYRLDKIEVIDQSTRPLYDERSAGLGAIIGPHFYRRQEDNLPPLPDDDLFPHIAKEKAEGHKDVFSHGIARYVPWNFTSDETSIKARLSSIDNYHGVLLSHLEGENFVMTFDATLQEDGLVIDFGVKTDKTGIVGLHYYYSIDHEDAVVKSVIQNVYNDMGEFKPLPDEWTEEDIHHLKFILNQEADFGFLPFSNNNTSLVTLENKEYNLEIFSQTESDEHSWQLWHPAGASFTCIEPMSAKNPRGILPKEGRIRVKITIVPKE